MNGDGARGQVTDVAKILYDRSEEIAIALAGAITREVRLDQSAASVPMDVVAESCGAHTRALFRAIAAGTAFDPGPATEVGIERARDGVPLASVMDAYGVGFREVWEAIAAESAGRIRVNDEAMRILTKKTLAAQCMYTAAMTISYREEQSHLLRNEESQRSLLFDRLLHGRLFDRRSVWEAADCLWLPGNGPFVVIAAEVVRAGDEALPEIESKLRSMDVYSAWRLLPDLHVGIVHIKTDKHLEKVLALVSRVAKSRVGVSPCFDDLRETAQALHYARVVLRGRCDITHPVVQFDSSILGCAAVSAPEVMVKLVTPIIECFAELADNEREVLFETFRAWLENDGSVRAAGEVLFCHANTVRYRLHRIEQRTGRSLSRPRDVAELCLAFEVHRRVM
jgi:PucR C-terminal helix-turn-helix domain/GGDEF-like domain